jgi:DNA-binding MarR family transcriptional regulator
MRRSVEARELTKARRRPRSEKPQFSVNFTPNFSPTQIVGTGLRATYHRFARELAANVAPLKLTMTMWFVLRELGDEDGLKQAELADRIHVSAAAMVKLVAQMSELGLVARRRGEDKRVFHVVLTRKGRSLRAKASALALQTDARALRGFSIGEVRSLLDMLARLRMNLGEDAMESPRRVWKFTSKR